MTTKQNPPPPATTTQTNQDKIKDLCAHLGGSLYNMPSDESLLDEQAQILNALFHATLARRLDIECKSHYSDSAREWLKIALQIQRQCAETLRTRKSIEYMDGLSAVNINAKKI